jgi:predicted membrane-bound spermidine synthase
LIVVDLLLAALALAVPFVLPALGAVQSTPMTFTLVEWVVTLLVALTGLLGGAAFPLAAGLQQGLTHKVGATAGVIIAADHAGACLGALLTGILLVPVLGTAATAYLLVAIKCISAGLLAVGRRLSPAAGRSEESASDS